MKCSKCNTENPNDAVFCWECGTKLVQKTITDDVAKVSGSKTHNDRQPHSVTKPTSNYRKSSERTITHEVSGAMKGYFERQLSNIVETCKYGDFSEACGAVFIVVCLIMYIIAPFVANIYKGTISGLLFWGGVIISCVAYNKYKESAWADEDIKNVLYIMPIISLILGAIFQNL